MLYADCEEVGQENLEPRGPLDVNGRISIAKVAGTTSTVPVSYFIAKIHAHIRDVCTRAILVIFDESSVADAIIFSACR